MKDFLSLEIYAKPAGLVKLRSFVRCGVLNDSLCEK